MKIALLGAAGARAPLLVRALAESDLPVQTLALFDVDGERLATTSRLAGRYRGQAALSTCESAEEAIEDADFVLASLRVGGMEQRALDEEACLELGVLGQETVGPAGFAMALRNVPAMVGYGKLVAEIAPDAFLVNYTNPVGIVTQAVAEATEARVVGVCDTPAELFAAAADVLGVEPERCRFDYVGLNHLGWLREIYLGDKPFLARLLEDDDALRRLYRAELFEPAFLREYALLPTEYLYFYYRSADAVEKLRRGGRTRGRTLVEANRELWRKLDAAESPEPLYEDYLAERDRGYFALESGGASRGEWRFEAAGYDRIALAVLRGIYFDTGDRLALNVTNGGSLSELEPGDTIEVPSILRRDGAHPLPTSIPEAARELMLAVKAYERKTVDCALAPTPEGRLDALASNPLVADRELAARLLARLGVAGC